MSHLHALWAWIVLTCHSIWQWFTLEHAADWLIRIWVVAGGALAIAASAFVIFSFSWWLFGQAMAKLWNTLRLGWTFAKFMEWYYLKKGPEPLREPLLPNGEPIAKQPDPTPLDYHDSISAARELALGYKYVRCFDSPKVTAGLDRLVAVIDELRRDMTENEELRAQLRERYKLEQVEREKEYAQRDLTNAQVAMARARERAKEAGLEP